MYRFILSCFLVLVLKGIAFAQFGPSTIGEWKALTPFRTGYSMVETEDNIIYVSNQGIVEINKEDFSFNHVSKVDGLTDSKPQLISYNEQTMAILLSYSNNDIDLIVNGDIINAPFIKNANNINGSRSINKLVSIDEFVYILTDFGVVKFDMEKLEVATTLKSDFPIYDMTIFDGRYILGTQEGVLSLDINSNILAFSFIDSWGLVSNEAGDQYSSETTALLALPGKLIIGNKLGQIIQHNALGQSDTLLHAMDSTVVFLGPDNDKGYFYILDCISGCRGLVRHVDELGQVRTLDRSCVDRPNEVIQDQMGRVWFGDRFSEYRWLEHLDGECQKIQTNSPNSSTVFDLDFAGENDLWLTTGSYELDNVTRFSFLPTTYMTYIDNKWNSFSWEKSNTILNEYNLGVMHNVAVDKKRNKIYLASFLDGLLEISGEEETGYNHENDHLGPNVEDPGRSMVFDLELAENGDLWMSNYNAEYPIRVKRVNGNWEKYQVSGRKELTDVLIDDYGNKWYVDNSNTNALVVFNDNGTASTADDESKTFNTSNSNMPSNSATFMVKDLDGGIWVGMDIGVMVFDCGSSVFSNDCNGFRPVIIEEGLPENLLNDERITAIEVDGGNRKWFGTTSGVFVHSPDGQDQEYHFTEENSPLFSNEISMIKINRLTGEVYIGTTEGLNMIQTDARQGEEFHKQEIYVYPNPVEPNYTGPIAFDGLAQDSDFRITDISGRLVYKSKSVGGQAIWYGHDVYGTRVKSGVYLIWGATEQLTTSSGVVGKVLIVSD